ncbi:hypothetical protein Hypma_006152 [Hypsizygus marmoreus]|uniref:Uncharacterized protein n=1 Tax=Hypsizygus marmoreus TaxID=39966 RepID=A0A369K2J6_HYPMA|nr:hypothetical protein Hypma_006152 [Hypsizygus marmoreus]
MLSQHLHQLVFAAHERSIALNAILSTDSTYHVPHYLRITSLNVMQIHFPTNPTRSPQREHRMASSIMSENHSYPSTSAYNRVIKDSTSTQHNEATRTLHADNEKGFI